MFQINRTAFFQKPLLQSDADLFSDKSAKEVMSFFNDLPDYQPTPLHSLSSLSKKLGVGSIHVKDEGFRMGLGSFKGLGGTYAVIKLILEKISIDFKRDIRFEDLEDPSVKVLVNKITVACATDGNHGRSVAFGARLVGARSVVFVHSGVSKNRKDAIASYGAVIKVCEGNYDDSVREAHLACLNSDWLLVSDTACEGYERPAGLVMQGYQVIVEEICSQLSLVPTHLFIQAGVGGLAGSMAGRYFQLYGKNAPKVIVVEPSRAACFFSSVVEDKLVAITSQEPTVMAMLECYEPSLIAWRIISRIASGFMQIEEEEAIDVMKVLAEPLGNDPVIVSGESGGVGLAGLLKALANSHIKQQLGLKEDSQIIIVNTEGATDPVKYSELLKVKG